MPQELLDEADVGSALQHVRRAGVAQKMAGTALFKPSASHPARDHAREDIRVKRPAVARQKERGCPHVDKEAPPHLAHVALHPQGRARPQRGDAVFVPLALAHRDGAALRVHVGAFQAAEFAAAQARRVKDFKHRSVPQAQRIGNVGHGHELRDFPRRESRHRQTLFRPGQFQLGSRVVQNHVLSRQPPEPVSKHPDPLPLRGPGEPPAGRRLVAREEALVRLQDGPRDLRSARHVSRLRPQHEAL